MDRELIVSAALELTLEKGLEALSLRSLATRLEVKAPSLYWHFESKQDLFAAMGERLLRQCLDGMDAHDGWETWLFSFGRQLWRAQVSMRDSGRLLMAIRANAVGTERFSQSVADKLAPFGLSYATANRMQWSVQALITGWLTFHQAGDCKFEDQVEASAMDSLRVLVDGWKSHGQGAC